MDGQHDFLNRPRVRETPGKLVRRFLKNENTAEPNLQSEVDTSEITDAARNAAKGGLVAGGVALSGMAASPADALEIAKQRPANIEQILQQEADREAAIKCLTDNVYHEARGEGVDGQFAAALVTLARTLEFGYPKDVCGVVYQRKQFSWTFDTNILKRPINEKKYNQIRHMLLERLRGLRVDEAVVILSMSLGLPSDTLFYKRTDWTRDSANPKTKLSKNSADFFDTLRAVKTIGNHTFYTKRKR